MDSDGDREPDKGTRRDSTTEAACAREARPPPPPPPPPGVLMVGKCSVRQTGNATTLARLGRAVQRRQWPTLTRDPDSLPSRAALHDLVTRHNIVAAVGLHAYRCAQVLLSCQELGVPYVLVFGGTDLNECVREADKLEVIGRVVAGAQNLIAFHSQQRDVAFKLWPSLVSDGITVLPQAVEVDPAHDFDVLAFLEKLESDHMDTTTLNSNNNSSDVRHGSSEELDKRDEIKSLPLKECVTENDDNTENNETENSEVNGKPLKNGTNPLINGNPRDSLPLGGVFSEGPELPAVFQPLVVLVAGLRPVKDVLYLTEAWSEWQQARGGRGRFLILGPALDQQYAAQVHEQAARLSGVRVAPSLAPEQCHAVIRSATVLVNSSRSEGMSSTILEAMMLGTPVVARDIPGNASLVTHGATGLLYSSPAAFLRTLEALLQDPGLGGPLIAAARDMVARRHSPRQEEEHLASILKRALH